MKTLHGEILRGSKIIAIILVRNRVRSYSRLPIVAAVTKVILSADEILNDVNSASISFGFFL